MHITRFLFLCLVAACAVASVLATPWDKDDHEIFDLQASLEELEGAGANFYSFLQVPRNAKAAAIKKAYRARSVELHPDKNPNTPHAHKRFERLALINKVLTDARRDRYDHFLTHGFPKWRGTGYYYTRFRPGLGSVLLLLASLSVALQYVVLRVGAAQDLARLRRLRAAAQVLAYGPRFRAAPAPAPAAVGTAEKTGKRAAERKVRVPLGGFDGLPPPPSAQDVDAGRVDWDAHEKAVRRAVAEAGRGSADAQRTVEVVVDAEGGAYALDPTTGDPLSLDDDAVPAPSLRSTWPFALVRRLTAKGDVEQEEPQADSTAVDVAPATTTATAAETRKRKGKKRQ